MEPSFLENVCPETWFWTHGRVAEDEDKKAKELLGQSSEIDNFLEIIWLVGGLVAVFYFPIYWVANDPN